MLALMAARGFHFSRPDDRSRSSARFRPSSRARRKPFQSSAVVEHVLDELKAAHADLGIDDLLQGHIQVYSTVDARVQRIVNEALEHGLERYEQRHPSAAGLVQGSVVV